MRDLEFNIGRPTNIVRLEDYLEKSFEEIKGKKKEKFMSLLEGLKKEDLEVYMHSLRTLPLALDSARFCGINIKPVIYAAPLHDIGKQDLDWNILHKPGRLTKEEEEHVKQHVIYGYAKLSPEFEYTAQIQGVHHVAYSGLVKPRIKFSKRNQDMIFFFGRIISIADHFDAMNYRSDHSSDRPKNKGEILNRFKNNNSDEYQMRLVTRLLEYDILKPM